MEIRTRAKRWGSSIGIILPKQIVDVKRIRENDEVIMEIKNRPLARDFFGRLKGKFKKSAQQLKNEAKEGWD